MKKHNYFLVAGITLLFLALFTMNYSCKNAGQKSAEQAMEQAIEQSTGEDADVNLSDQGATIHSGDVTSHIDAGANKWPADAPAEIPEFTFGKIKGVTTSDHPELYNWTIVYEEVPADAFKKYNDLLKAKGMETMFMDMAGQGGSITCEFGDLTISVMGGEGNAVVGFSKKKPQ
jgi:hypothetical protein